jgi:hypothetical protein
MLIGFTEMMKFFFLYGQDAPFTLPQAIWVKKGLLVFFLGGVLSFSTINKQTIIKYDEIEEPDEEKDKAKEIE